MARLFGGFGKKKKQQDPAQEPDQAREVSSPSVDEEVAPSSQESSSEHSEVISHEVPEHGPFDGDTVNMDEYDFSDFSAGILNLGSMRIPLPKASQVQVEMAEKGPRMLHVITHHGRITPVAFAAPSSSGLWEDASQEILEGMQADGVEARFEEGFWGKEIVGEAGPNLMRIVGIDGPRWMLRLSLVGPKDRADKLVELTREMAARTFVYRGNNPILAGNSLPVTLPQELVAQVQEQMKQRQNHMNAQANAQQQQTQQADSESLNEAAAMLRNLAANNPAGGQNTDGPAESSPEKKES